MRLSTTEFEAPILEALHGMGGRGERPRVLDSVETILGRLLTADDYEGRPHPNESTSVWKWSADSMKRRMIKDGLIHPVREWGIWELTPKGYNLARRVATGE